MSIPLPRPVIRTKAAASRGASSLAEAFGLAGALDWFGVAGCGLSRRTRTSRVNRAVSDGPGALAPTLASEQPIVAKRMARYPATAIRCAVTPRRRPVWEIAQLPWREASAALARQRQLLGLVQAYRREHSFALGLRRTQEDSLAAVAVCARPHAELLDDGLTLELCRLGLELAAQKVCSKMLRAVARVAASMGYRRLVAYTRGDALGAQLYAAGWDPASKSVHRQSSGSDDDGQTMWVAVLRGELRGCR